VRSSRARAGHAGQGFPVAGLLSLSLLSFFFFCEQRAASHWRGALRWMRRRLATDRRPTDRNTTTAITISTPTLHGRPSGGRDRNAHTAGIDAAYSIYSFPYVSYARLTPMGHGISGLSFFLLPCSLRRVSRKQKTRRVWRVGVCCGSEKRKQTQNPYVIWGIAFSSFRLGFGVRDRLPGRRTIFFSPPAASRLLVLPPSLPPSLPRAQSKIDVMIPETPGA
jgi:hypothetical protein